MSEVLIVMQLRRRSGVLAAAVAAVHRAGLEFQSQRLVDNDGATLLHLVAAGDINSVESVAETMGAVSGVSEVVDILRDGASLIHLPEEPEIEDESVIEPDTALFAENPWSEFDDEPTEANFETEASSKAKAAPEARPMPQPEPEAEPEPEPEPKPEPEPEPESESNEPEKVEKKAPNGPRMITPAMRRRRRWR